MEETEANSNNTTTSTSSTTSGGVHGSKFFVRDKSGLSIFCLSSSSSLTSIQSQQEQEQQQPEQQQQQQPMDLGEPIGADGCGGCDKQQCQPQQIYISKRKRVVGEDDGRAAAEVVGGGVPFSNCGVNRHANNKRSGFALSIRPDYIVQHLSNSVAAPGENISRKPKPTRTTATTGTQQQHLRLSGLLETSESSFVCSNTTGSSSSSSEPRGGSSNNNIAGGGGVSNSSSNGSVRDDNNNNRSQQAWRYYLSICRPATSVGCVTAGNGSVDVTNTGIMGGGGGSSQWGPVVLYGGRAVAGSSYKSYL
eukprot:GHVS01080649.1.p1 GENE.GHVS01080649.1~~GHVS01080649.1.p1  ORF type:complete len:307 (-),score=124.67 GHVS01080649.1:145-1065(-)